MQTHLVLKIKSASLPDAVERIYASVKHLGPAMYVVTVEAVSADQTSATEPAKRADAPSAGDAGASPAPAPVADPKAEAPACPAVTGEETRAGVEASPAPRKRGRPPKVRVIPESGQPAVPPNNTGSGSPTISTPVTSGGASPSGDAAAVPTQPATPVAPAPASPAITKDNVRDALQAVVAKFNGNLDRGADALSRFGAKRLSELPVERYTDFIAYCKDVVATGNL